MATALLSFSIKKELSVIACLAQDQKVEFVPCHPVAVG